MPQVPVTVIIPVFNRQDVVRRAIDSVLNQTFRDFELLVIDDGSTDASAAVIGQVADSRLRLLRSPRRHGAAAARNLGLTAARGASVAFLDSDDLWLPRKLEKQVAAMEAAPLRAAAICTGYYVHRVRSDRRFPRIPMPSGSGWFDTLLDGCTVSPGSTLMVRRSAFEEIGPFDVSLPRLEDWDWLLRYVDHSDLLMVPEVLAEVMVTGHPEPPAVAESTRMLFQRHTARIRKKRGRAGVRRFRATLLIEQSVAHIRHREMVSGAVAAAGALALSPGRFLDLVRRGLAKMRQRDM